MCETKLKLQVVLIVLGLTLSGLNAVDDWASGLVLLCSSPDRCMASMAQAVATLLFTVTRAPRYFGILQDHRGEPLSVEVSEEYMDQDYIATNRKRHKIDWNKNPLDMDDFDDDDTDEIFDDKDKDVKVPNKYNLQAGPV